MMFRFLIARQSQDEGLGLFVGGYAVSVGNSVATMQKYSFASGAVSGGKNLVTPRMALAATGTTTIGYFAAGRLGNTTTYYSVTEKYTFVADTMLAGANITGGARWGLAGCGNSSVGVFGAGFSVSSTSKYVYSGDTTSAGTSIYEAWGVGAGSNSTAGVFGAGWSNAANSWQSQTKKYTFSTDSVVNGMSLSTATFGVTGASSPVTAYFFGGARSGDVSISNTDKFNIAAGTVTSGGALAQGRDTAAAAATSSKIIVAAGGYYTGPSTTVQIASTELYSIASDTFSNSTSLIVTRSWHAAVSTTPGHL